MQTIGERLEEARKKKGISIREAAEATKIRGDYLSRFENNQFDINLTELYVRGFLRTYAQFLRLPADRILNDYAALGRGEARPRQPSREIYGRMDVSIASADERPESAAPTVEESSAAAAATAATRRPSSMNRGIGTPSTPHLDPALVWMIVKWAGIALAGILVLWGIISLFSGDSAKPAAKSASAPASPVSITQPAESTVTIIAFAAVRVTVAQKNPDASHGPVIFQGTMVRGESQTVPKPGPIYITASAAENIEIEYRGKRYPTGYKGYQTVQLQ